MSTSIEPVTGLSRDYAMELENMAMLSASIDGIWRTGLHFGDRLVVFTLNSVYTLLTVGDDQFIASGGWFERKQLSPALVRISGCSWGGTVLNKKLVAAPGLHLEFSNGVVTTKIQKVLVSRHQEAPIPN